MAQTLQMVFRDQIGKSMTISVVDPREDLTQMELETVMNDIIAKNIFDSNGHDLAEIYAARIIDRQVTEII